MTEDWQLDSGAVRRGLILKDQRRYAEAEHYFREALAANPRDAFSLHQMAVCQLQSADRASEALATVNQALSLEPNESDHLTLKAFILCALQRPREGLETAKLALARAPTSPGVINAQTQALLQLERWPEAEQSARWALAQDADNSVAANQLAEALRMQNKMIENADQIAGMLARDPENAWTHTQAGLAALQRGDHRTAQTHFREALRLDPAGTDARNGLLQAFKARSPLYQTYLNYCFWMQRQNRGRRALVLVALFLIPWLSRLLFTGALTRVAALVTVLYLLFALWVWVAQSVGNLFLLFDRFARYALRPMERVDAVVVGGGVLAGLLLIVAGVGWSAPAPVVLGATLLGSAFPFSRTFTNPSPVGRGLFGGLAATVLVGGGVLLAKIATPWGSQLDDGLVAATTALAALATVSSTWLGNVAYLRQG